MRIRDIFRKFARVAEDGVSPAAFLLGVSVTLIWVFTDAYFHYSDTGQLVINTGASIGTSLIVFLIQNTQNCDAKVMRLKLDELIRAFKSARTELLQMEGLTDEELADLQKEFQLYSDRATINLRRLTASRQGLDGSALAKSANRCRKTIRARNTFVKG
jgi:low affinity Fe/Cu permease